MPFKRWGGGGIHIDTLFVDEGFGSPNGVTKEGAPRMLQVLVNPNVLVGKISHISNSRGFSVDRLYLHRKRQTGREQNYDRNGINNRG